MWSMGAGHAGSGEAGSDLPLFLFLAFSHPFPSHTMFPVREGTEKDGMAFLFFSSCCRSAVSV